jgi:hypothetical protein
MSLKLNAPGGGSVTLQEPTTASNVTLNLPAVNGNLVTTADVGSVSSSMIADGSVTPAKLSQRLTSGTAVATTSGTAIDFTSIPSWVRRITVMLSGVSTNGSSNLLLRVGSGSIQTSGYDSTASCGTAAGTYQSSTAGFLMTYPLQTANSVFKGTLVLTLLGSNTWIQSGCISDSVYQLLNNGSSGSVTLSGTLDRVRLTTVNGTDAFDAGSINILFE